MDVLIEECGLKFLTRLVLSCDVAPQLEYCTSNWLFMVAQTKLQHLSDAGPLGQRRIGDVGFTGVLNICAAMWAY
jgi:hypothetical protein